ncbi:putative late blight resistance protein homolog R1A-10 [Lycium ferocissimum]|uniref:putative late blight resistance protein homolog R1A-10 n=1 Tax=Lycium ferocissimum TaxID=112874 RepID=UPI002814FE66|nr:putative late blight resistance protein homolog R1A-10 [Lycium ferocissimum]
MGGIGKSTLARRNDPSISCRFNVTSWVTVSQEYDAREMLLDVLSCFFSPNEMKTYHKMSEDELLEKVHRILKCKRYLIALDYIWSIEAWDQVKRSFPDDGNGSRVVITTRLLEVADCADNIGCRPHHMSFLNLEDSWKLLSLKLFGYEDSCPPQLKQVGRLIGQQCQGLPLSIVVIAGVLSNIDRTYDDWIKISDNMNSHIGSTFEQCLSILALSYNYLPCSLTACFLSMGVYREDAEIDVDGLIRVWVAEGFLKRSISHKKPEEVAEECLEDLVSRCLVMFTSRAWVTGKITGCKIHDLVRLLCLREGKAEKFFHVINKCYSEEEGVHIERRLILHEDAVRNQNLGLEKCSLDSVRAILCLNRPGTF